MTKLGKPWMVKMIERENKIKETRNVDLALEHIQDLKGTLRMRNEVIADLRKELEKTM